MVQALKITQGCSVIRGSFFKVTDKNFPEITSDTNISQTPTMKQKIAAIQRCATSLAEQFPYLYANEVQALKAIHDSLTTEPELQKALKEHLPHRKLLYTEMWDAPFFVDTNTTP